MSWIIIIFICFFDLFVSGITLPTGFYCSLEMNVVPKFYISFRILTLPST